MLYCGYTCSKTAKEKPLTSCPAKRSGMAAHEIGEWSSMPHLYSQQVSSDFLFYHYDEFHFSLFKHKMYTVFLLLVVQYNPWT